MGFLSGKRVLIVGVASKLSIASGIAAAMHREGAELAFTYLGESLERRVRPLAESVGAKLLIPADVTDDASMDAAFAELEKTFGTIDFVVHSVAFANKDELKGSFVDNTTRDSFLLALNISAFSFVDVSRRAAKLMPNGGSLITLTYLGSERVIPNYNTMGVAKAAWPRRRWRRRPAISRATWGPRTSASTPFRPGPCAPCRWPESRAGAACTPSRPSSR